MRRALIAAALLSVASVTSAAVDPDRLVVLGKRTNVHRIDPALPNQTLETWLRRVVGGNAVVEWEVNDCGEGPDPTGPACVEVNVYLAAGGHVTVSLLAPDDSVGFRAPEDLGFAAIDSVGPHVDVRRLSALPRALASARTLARELSARPPHRLEPVAAIDSVRRLSAMRLDRALPAMAFDAWLTALAPAGAEIEWLVEGCDHSPVGDEWAYVIGKIESANLSASIRVRVGTCFYGIFGRPVADSASVYDKRPGHIGIRKVALPALAARLRTIQP